MRFLRDEIDSVRELEMLLALRAAGVGTITPAALSAQLRTGERWAEDQLALLARKGLVAVTPDTGEQAVYRYAPETDDRTAVIDEVARLFETHRTTVIRLVFAEPRGGEYDS